ncbi:MAG: glycosyl transferase [Bacteroidales bacterium]|nr:glycosyl transferase [Bacteroidales bacterium]
MNIEWFRLSHWKKIFWNRITTYSRPFLTDKAYLKFIFKHRVGYPLNLDAPQTYNEKLQWLKLNDIHPEYQDMVDKATAKSYVASILGDKYVIPTLGLWDSIDDIEWEKLPEQFVIKATGDSGGVYICQDKNKFNKSEAIKKLKNAGLVSYNFFNLEYPYKNVRRRYIAEAYMEDESGFELKDYKFFCFNGVPRFLFVATGRQQNDTRFDFYDTAFNHLPLTNGHANADVWPTKPQNFEEMLLVAEKLSQGIPHVRVDLYNINGKIYFGEMTFFHWSGFVPFEPVEWDYKFGEYLQLPKV